MFLGQNGNRVVLECAFGLLIRYFSRAAASTFFKMPSKSVREK